MCIKSIPSVRDGLIALPTCIVIAFMVQANVASNKEPITSNNFPNINKTLNSQKSTPPEQQVRNVDIVRNFGNNSMQPNRHSGVEQDRPLTRGK